MFVFAAVMGANEPSNGFETNKIYQKNSSAVFVQIRRLLNPRVYNPRVSVTLRDTSDMVIILPCLCP